MKTLVVQWYLSCVTCTVVPVLCDLSLMRGHLSCTDTCLYEWCLFMTGTTQVAKWNTHAVCL